MPKEILRQRSWNGGELDPDLVGRDDVKAYFSSAALLENVLCVPQGPLKRRPGTTFVDRCRFQLTAIELDAGMLTAPRGGTVADVLTANGTSLLTVTDMAVIDPYVVLEIDLGAPMRVDLVDLVDYGLHDTGGGGTAPGVPPFEFPWSGGGGGYYGGFPGFPGGGGVIP